jgi:hypothetical protein
MRQTLRLLRDMHSAHDGMLSDILVHGNARRNAHIEALDGTVLGNGARWQ